MGLKLPWCEGVFDGFYSFNDLGAQGDFGIGTFDSLEGEMIALDPVAKIPEYNPYSAVLVFKICIFYEIYFKLIFTIC